MILSMLISVLAFAGDLNRECAVNDPGLQRFFSEYVEAYAKADRKALKEVISNEFWESYSEVAPKKPSKRFRFKILRILVKGEYCHVQWATSEPGKRQEEPAWFRLELKDKWKIDGVSGELED